MSEKKAQRRVLEQMMDSVTEGHAFTVYGANGPLAMVLPWSDWQALNAALIAAGGTVILTDPEEPEPGVPSLGDFRRSWGHQHLGASARRTDV